MNPTYNIEEWTAATVLGRQVFNYNYHFSGNEFKGWKLIKAVALMESEELTQKVFLFENITNPKHEILRIDVFERFRWQQALQSLQQNLQSKMRIDIPKGTGNAESIGDVNYIAREERSDIPAAIFFTRGNLFLSLTCVGDTNFDVSDVAVRIDDELHLPPSKSELDKEKAKRIKPHDAVTDPKEPAVLISNFRKQFKKNLWVKIIVPDGEVYRRDGQLLYISPRKEKKTVNVFITDRG